MEYEDRTLFSATPVGGDLLVQAEGGTPQPTTVDSQSTTTDQGDGTTSTATAAPSDDGTQNLDTSSSLQQSQDSGDRTVRNELVIVDASVSNYQQLIDDLAANTDEDRQLHVVLLDAEGDGIQQVTDLLAKYDNLMLSTS